MLKYGKKRKHVEISKEEITRATKNFLESGGTIKKIHPVDCDFERYMKGVPFSDNVHTFLTE